MDRTWKSLVESTCCFNVGCIAASRLVEKTGLDVASASPTTTYLLEHSTRTKTESYKKKHPRVRGIPAACHPPISARSHFDKKTLLPCNPRASRVLRMFHIWFFSFLPLAPMPALPLLLEHWFRAFSKYSSIRSVVAARSCAPSDADFVLFVPLSAALSKGFFVRVCCLRLPNAPQLRVNPCPASLGVCLPRGSSALRVKNSYFKTQQCWLFSQSARSSVVMAVVHVC